MTETSPAVSSSSCWSTGSTVRVAKMSLGSSSTGMRSTVASAAPVIMFVEPGPMEAAQAKAWRRFVVRA